MSVATIKVAGGEVRKLTSRHHIVKEVRLVDGKAVVWQCCPEHCGYIIADLMAGLGFRVILADLQYFLAIKSKKTARQFLDVLNTMAEEKHAWLTPCYRIYDPNEN